MPEPYVTSAKIAGGKIILSVLVNDFKTGEYLEISGQATQTGGAFANFYDIQPVPDAPNGDKNDPNDKTNYYIYVTGAPAPHQFRHDQDVSVVARVARVWLTVLKGQPPPKGAVLPSGQTAVEGTTWKEREVSQLNGASW